MIIICNSIRRKFLLVDMRFESENEQIRLGYSPTKIIWLMENCLGEYMDTHHSHPETASLGQTFVCWLQHGFLMLSLKWHMQHLPVACPCWPWCRTLISPWPRGRGRPAAFSPPSTSSAASRLASPHPEPSFQHPCHKISAITWKQESVKTEYYASQLSNLWWISNSVSKGFDTAMKTGSSRRFKRYVYVSVKLTSLYCGLRIILVNSNRQ